jgi:hypothetical protein
VRVKNQCDRRPRLLGMMIATFKPSIRTGKHYLGHGYT